MCAGHATPPKRRHWPTVATPFPPYSSHAAAHTTACLPWRTGKHPHRLAPNYKSRRLLSSHEHRAVARPPLATPGELIAPPTPHGCLSTPKPSPRTHRAYPPTCWPNRAACSLEPELPRPPPGSHCRARTSLYSPSLGTHLAPSLGHLGANRTTLCSALHLSSPETERPRPCHH
jgi:hypothetical protein